MPKRLRPVIRLCIRQEVADVEFKELVRSIFMQLAYERYSIADVELSIFRAAVGVSHGWLSDGGLPGDDAARQNSVAMLFFQKRTTKYQHSLEACVDLHADLETAHFLSLLSQFEFLDFTGRSFR